MADAKTLCAALRGAWHGRYGVACCPAHGDTRPSLSLSNAPDGRLLLRCHSGCAFLDILDALRGLGLIEGRGSIPAIDPAVIAQREAEARALAEKKARQAQQVWDASQPIKGTLAEVYLRGRAITCPLPASLRFHPECWHPSARRYPALIARVDGAERFAVHRTYLANDSSKAKADPAKAMLGRVGGGAVRLCEAQGPLVVAEGIETGLSLACGLLREPSTVWAALSTSGLSGLGLPPHPGRLTIAPDGDKAGTTAARQLAERADALGWQVSILPAPDERRDWNDVLRQERAA